MVILEQWCQIIGVPLNDERRSNIYCERLRKTLNKYLTMDDDKRKEELIYVKEMDKEMYEELEEDPEY